MTWLYDIVEQKVAASRSDERAARFVGASAGRVQPNRRGLHSRRPSVFGRTTGKGNDHLPKPERYRAIGQPGGGLSHSLSATLLPPKGQRWRMLDWERAAGASSKISGRRLR